MIRTILFDLDDTLYPPHSGIMDQIRNLILSYIQTRLQLGAEEAEELRRRYLREYGTTMRGLQINHQIDADEYLAYVHDIPLPRYIQPNPALGDVLGRIPQRKVVFTNASREHAEGVLGQLGVRRQFDAIIDVRDLEYESKPQPGAYVRACVLVASRPEECLIVEDSVRNLEPARALGMTTVLVWDGTTTDLAAGGGSTQGSAVDYVIERIEEIGQVLEGLG